MLSSMLAAAKIQEFANSFRMGCTRKVLQVVVQEMRVNGTIVHMTINIPIMGRKGEIFDQACDVKPSRGCDKHLNII